MRYAINTPKFFEDELPETLGEGRTMFGAAADIVDDLVDLGIRVARHPNVVQFFPDVIWGDNGDGSGGIPLDPADFSADISASDLPRRLTELITLLHATGRPIKLDITFLSLGGGWATFSDASRSGTRSPTPTSWHTDHVGQVDASGNAFDTTEDAGYDVGTLDPSSPYKRVFYAAFAQALVDMLGEIQAQFDSDGAGIQVEDWIEAIEIGNEVDARDLIPDPDKKHASRRDFVADSASWAAVYVDAARIFRAALPAVKLKLPALASTADVAIRPESAWSAKTRFILDMVEALRTLYTEGSVAEIIDGIDLHYYHRRDDSTAADTQPLAYLVADVAELRVLLAPDLPDLEVSIIESGTGTYCEDTAETWLRGYNQGCEASAVDYPAYQGIADSSEEVVADFRPTLGESPTTTVGANDFQGQMVWMRMAVAAAALRYPEDGSVTRRGEVAGWHTLMNNPVGGFATMGLRRDWHPWSTDPSEARQRVSYWAMRRYVATLGVAKAVRVVLPTGIPATHDILSTSISDGSWGAEKSLWLIEFECSASVVGHSRSTGGVLRRFSYLAFLDPFGSAASADVTFSGADDSAVTRVPTQPLAVAHSAPKGFLPDAQWFVSGPTTVAAPGESFLVHVGRGAWPVFLTSDQPLTAVATVST